jgi:translation initiation factor IF-3
MDYGKFKYEAAQKAKEARKNQANTILKEVRFRLKIDTHDYETKRKRAESFLKAGDKVKAMILFRGREQSRPEQGVRLLQRFAEDVADYGIVEFTPMIDGRNMVMIIAPLKTKAEAKAEAMKSSKKTPVRDVAEEEKPAVEPAAEVTTETTTAAKPAAKAAAKPAAKASATKAPAKPAAKAAAKPAAKTAAKTTTQKEENNA